MDAISDVLQDKLIDLANVGLVVEFDPDEADIIGAFQDDAISESAALESVVDAEGV